VGKVDQVKGTLGASEDLLNGTHRHIS